MRISDWSSDVCSSDLQEKLIAPEDETGGARKGEPRAAGALHDVKARRDQRIAAKGKDDARGVQRAQPPEAGIFDPEVEHRIGELQRDEGAGRERRDTPGGDRKSDVEGTRVSVRLGLGGRRIIKKTKRIKAPSKLNNK